MQHRSLLKIDGLRKLRIGRWRRFGCRLLRVVDGTDHTTASNMVAVVNGSTMVFDTNNRRWLYGPSVDEATERDPSGARTLDGLKTHVECLQWCDDYLYSKKVMPMDMPVFDSLAVTHPEVEVA